jgi:hypothetical protein
MQGGGLGENAIVPLNLSRGGKVDVVVSGAWSEKSAAEARRYADVAVAASNAADQDASDDGRVGQCGDEAARDGGEQGISCSSDGRGVVAAHHCAACRSAIPSTARTLSQRKIDVLRLAKSGVGARLAVAPCRLWRTHPNPAFSTNGSPTGRR